MNVIVLADYREKSSGIIEALEKNKIKVNLLNLPVGDFLISDRAVIERKTGEDFLQSIIDGRLFNQAEEMTRNFEKVFFMIEGKFHNLRNIHENAIRGALVSLFFDYNIPVIKTKNIVDSADFITHLAKREQIGEKREVRLRGNKRKMTLANQQQFIIESLPGVGPNLAKELLKHFGSIKGVFTANERELRQVKKIGKKKARNKIS